MDLEGRYYEVQAAFTGAETQVGPYIDVSKTALRMQTVGKHRHHSELDISRCKTLPGCDMTFLDSQITGMAFMLQRSTGGVPVSSQRAAIADIAEAQNKLRSIRSFGGFLVDVTELGKTDTSLGFASQYTLYADHGHCHKPLLIVVPNGAVFSQWSEKIYDHYKDLMLIISNDSKPSEAKFLKDWVSATAMREAPDKLNNWPTHFQFIFNTEDPRASKAVILSPYYSHALRTVETSHRKRFGYQLKARGKGKNKRKEHKGHPQEEPVYRIN